MAVKLCIRDSFPAAENFADEGIVEIIRNPPFPPCIATIGKGDCACDSPHEWVVDGKCISFRNESNLLATFPGYALEGSFSSEEQTTVLTWLTRSKFYALQHAIENGTLTRYMSHTAFKKIDSKCGKCFRYRLGGIPVFCLKKIVVSGENKGPTLESVLG